MNGLNTESAVTASLFGQVVKRRKTNYPLSMVITIVKPSRKSNESCKWGNDNENRALIKIQ